MENEDYIKRVIGDNDIIFLIPHFFYFKDVNFKWFSLDINVYQGNYKLGMTELFGRAPGLISYLKSNYPTEKQRNNQIFKMEKEKKDMSKRESEIEIRNVVEKQAISDVDNAYKAVNIKEEQCQNLARLISVC